MNSAFSVHLPALQIAWDSTSVGTLKECPRKYYYSMLAAGDQNGFAPRIESVHLTFGIYYHAALERYDHYKCDGLTHDEAQIKAVHWLLTATWDRELNRPWASDDPNKNRYTLVRTVVWYLEQFADDPVETLVLANGKPAVELSFRMELGLTAPTGEAYLLCGHLDRLGKFQDRLYILDRKTSKNTLNSDYFQKYSPDNQFSTYTFGARVAYSQHVSGLIVDAAQIAVNFSRFQRGFISRTDDQLDEWFRDLQWTIRSAEYFAKSNYWPMNDKSCNNYGGCPFRSICSKPPSVRDQWLNASFTKRQWDPLQVRGDI